jgi:virginiamycin B lyase
MKDLSFAFFILIMYFSVPAIFDIQYGIIKAFAIPSDQTTAIKSSWTIPNNPGNESIPIKTSFGGDVYFAENKVNKIGRLVPSTNTITEWDIPTGSSGVSDIKFDESSGNIYFVENKANKIGRLVPLTGVFTEWKTESAPQNIEIDPSGDIHFSELGGGIVRID